MVEKPAEGSAPSNLAVIGRYILTPKIMQNLNKMKSGAGGEIQLTDAIAEEIKKGRDVFGYRFRGQRFDCGYQGRLPAGDRGLRAGPRRSARRILAISWANCRRSSGRRSRPCPRRFWSPAAPATSARTPARCWRAPATPRSPSTIWSPAGEAAVKFGPFEQGDLMDRDRLDDVFARYQPQAVMHFAALSQVGESMRKPGTLLAQQRLRLAEPDRGGGRRRAASISCSPRPAPPMASRTTCCWTKASRSGRSTPMAPRNGRSRTCCANFGESHGLHSVIFRYFNVAGCRPRGRGGRIPPARDASDPADAGRHRRQAHAR